MIIGVHPQATGIGPTAFGGLGATGYLCNASYCSGSTAAQQALFKDLQRLADRILATTPAGAFLGTPDGKLGKNTVRAIATVGMLAKTNGTLNLPTLSKFAETSPTIASVAANATSIVREMTQLAPFREKVVAQGAAPGAAPQVDSKGRPLPPDMNSIQAQIDAQKAQMQLDAAIQELAQLKQAAAITAGADKAAADAKVAAKAEEVALTKDAVSRLIGSSPFRLPTWSTNPDTNRAINAIGALALLFIGYRFYMRGPAPRAAATPTATVAGLRGRGGVNLRGNRGVGRR